MNNFLTFIIVIPAALSLLWLGVTSPPLTYQESDKVVYVVDEEEGILQAQFLTDTSSITAIPKWVVWIEGDYIFSRDRKGIVHGSELSTYIPNTLDWVFVEKKFNYKVENHD